LSLLRRFAFDATRRRYRRTMSSPDAPVISFPPASMAAATFSATMSVASRWAPLPPSISFASRNPITRLASTANIKASNVRCLFLDRFMTPPASLLHHWPAENPHSGAEASATHPITDLPENPLLSLGKPACAWAGLRLDSPLNGRRRYEAGAGGTTSFGDRYRRRRAIAERGRSRRHKEARHSRRAQAREHEKRSRFGRRAT
jgi:hypothetical protein